MNIIDTTQEFFPLWNDNKTITIEDLDNYYRKFPDLFDNYFKSHCARTLERLNTAIERYPGSLGAMRRAANLLPSIACEVYDGMSEILQHPMPLKLRLLVGGYGSNAYVTHDGTLHFAVELLPDEPALLRVLVSHEMAHAFHFHILREAGFSFTQLAWDGYTSLYLEGLATFMSKLQNPGLPETVYFAFDHTGDEWVSFCKDHYESIKARINDDLRHWSMEEEVEWFRLRGGKAYGRNRLGYFVGTQFISALVNRAGLSDTVSLWAKLDIRPVIQQWLNEGNVSLGV